MVRVVLEYHLIGRLPTCVGNQRIRILADGRVEHSVNTRECEPDERWSSDWREAGRLDDASLARLLAAVKQSGLLDLPPSMIDANAEGGRREELIVSLDGADHTFVAQNSDSPALRAVVRLLWDALGVVGL